MRFNYSAFHSRTHTHTPDASSPYRGAAVLPAKNTALTSSIGSVATITTVADGDVNDPEECGRVGGWLASFDKLIGDHLGVQCLLVSHYDLTCMTFVPTVTSG